jgi:hypothetical protein
MTQRKGHVVENVTLLEDGFDDFDDIGDIISTSRGERRTPCRYGGDHRRSNRFAEDGYGDQDFA